VALFEKKENIMFEIFNAIRISAAYFLLDDVKELSIKYSFGL